MYKVKSLNNNFCISLYKYQYEPVNKTFEICYNFSKDAKFSLGEHTLSVPMELYSLNRERLCKHLSEVVVEDAYVLLQGGSNLSHYCTDVDYVFRQVNLFSCFFYVF